MPHSENVRNASAPARAGTINRACLASLTSLYGHPVATHWRVLCLEPKVLKTILDESELPEDVKSFKLVLEEMWNMARKVPTDEEALCKDFAIRPQQDAQRRFAPTDFSRKRPRVRKCTETTRRGTFAVPTNTIVC